MGGGASKIEENGLAEQYVDLIAATAEHDQGFRKKLVEKLELGGMTKKQDLEIHENIKSYERLQEGDPDTAKFRIQAAKDGKPMSLWHDVPLHHVVNENERTGHYHFVCEIPKWTRKKFEIATTEEGTPIKQDEKKGTLREFKTGAAGLFFNYGCFPQTWEDPNHEHPDAKAMGDNDPLDVCEIGSRQIGVGEIRVVKPLGILCMIDEGEADWKVIAIDVNDMWAPLLHDVADVERLLPGTISAIREWFRDYKVADGKPQNKFGLDEECMNRSYTESIIKECHEAWFKLLTGECTRAGSAEKLHVQHRPSMASLSPEQIAKLQSTQIH